MPPVAALAERKDRSRPAGDQRAPQAKPRGGRADPRGLASWHCTTVLSRNSAVLSKARWRQNAPSGIVNTISPLRCVSLVWAAASRRIGPTILRQPTKSAPARNTRKSDKTSARRAVLARTSPRRGGRDDGAPAHSRFRSDRAFRSNEDVFASRPTAITR